MWAGEGGCGSVVQDWGKKWEVPNGRTQHVMIESDSCSERSCYCLLFAEWTPEEKGTRAVGSQMQGELLGRPCIVQGEVTVESSRYISEGTYQNPLVLCGSLWGPSGHCAQHRGWARPSASLLPNQGCMRACRVGGRWLAALPSAHPFLFCFLWGCGVSATTLFSNCLLWAECTYIKESINLGFFCAHLFLHTSWHLPAYWVHSQNAISTRELSQLSLISGKVRIRCTLASILFYCISACKSAEKLYKLKKEKVGAVRSLHPSRGSWEKSQCHYNP